MIRGDALREYARASLWVLPAACAVVALVAGSLTSLIDVGPSSPIAFQGTADDARALLIGIASTMVTVIALLLGLAVVALQLASTQFSPRLLRNFLRDRPNQIVLGVVVGTFAYSAAGLFTVGVAGGQRVDQFPRLAVTIAIVLLFVSLGLLVYFADHLAHSIQVDNVMRIVEHSTLPVIHRLGAGGVPPEEPGEVFLVPALSSGYLQVVHIDRLLPAAAASRIHLRLHPKVGDHIVEGAPSPRRGRSPPTVAVPGRSFAEHLRLGVGLIRRYGAAEPTVICALLRLLAAALHTTGRESQRWEAIETEATLLLAAAERETAESADLTDVHSATAALRQALKLRREQVLPGTDHAEQTDL